MLTDKTEIAANVLEVLEATIKYKRFDNPNGPLYTVSKTRIYQVVYANGLVENFSKMPVTAVKPATVKPDAKAVTTAKTKAPPKPVFTKYTPAQYLKEREKMYSEKREATMPDSSMFKHALVRLPNVVLHTAAKKEVKLNDFLSTDPKFMQRPTLIITWAWTWCGPCVRIIDSLLLNLETSKELYNVVIINKGEKNTKGFANFDKVKQLLNENDRLNYYTQATMLFDFNNELVTYDEGKTPLIMWVNKKLELTNIALDLRIKVADIEIMLREADKEANRQGHKSYITQNYIACPEANAFYYFAKEVVNDTIIKLTVHENATDKILYTAFFTIDANGHVSPF